MGGYHGAWLAPHEVAVRRVSRADLAAAGAALGAGIVLPLDQGACPVELTARIVEYLAGQSARRCGPCSNGLPALAEAARAARHRGVAHRDPGRMSTWPAGRRARRVRAPGRHGAAGRARCCGRSPTRSLAHENRQCRAAAGVTVR